MNHQMRLFREVFFFFETETETERQKCVSAKQIRAPDLNPTIAAIA